MSTLAAGLFTRRDEDWAVSEAMLTPSATRSAHIRCNENSTYCILTSVVCDPRSLRNELHKRPPAKSYTTCGAAYIGFRGLSSPEHLPRWHAYLLDTAHLQMCTLWRLQSNKSDKGGTFNLKCIRNLYHVVDQVDRCVI